MKRGLTGKFANVLRDMFGKAKTQIKWNGKFSNYIDSLYGVLQGGIISPKLFIEFLQDLTEYLDKSFGIVIDDLCITHLLYADDLVLISSSKCGLDSLLSGLYNFCKSWHMIVNRTKTKIMVFGRKKSTYRFTYNSENIDVINN